MELTGLVDTKRGSEAGAGGVGWIGGEALEREALLLSMVGKCGEIKGRKKFQKMLYVAKAMGYPVREDFEWANYGVFSSQLQTEIDSLVNDEKILEVDISGAERPEYRYTLTRKGAETVEELDRIAGILSSGVAREGGVIQLNRGENLATLVGNQEMEALFKFLEYLNAQSTRILELWSSLLYLRLTEKNEQNLISFLHYLKPQYSREEISEGIAEVEELARWEFGRVRESGAPGAENE